MNDPLMGPGADVPFPPLEDGASVAAEKEDGAEKDGGAEEKKEDAEKPDEAKEEVSLCGLLKHECCYFTLDKYDFLNPSRLCSRSL